MWDRVIVFAIGLGLLLLSWRMVTRPSWTTEGAESLAGEQPTSRLRRWNVRADQVLTRVVVPALTAALGAVATLVALLGWLE